MSPPITLDGSNDSKQSEAGEGKIVYEAEDVRQVNSQDNVEARPAFRQKVKRHCARFWWIHLIIFCISFLIIALCL